MPSEVVYISRYCGRDGIDRSVQGNDLLAQLVAPLERFNAQSTGQASHREMHL